MDASAAGGGVSAITEQVASMPMPSDDDSNAKAEMNLDDLDALGEKLCEKLVALQGVEQSKFAKQGIQLLLASGLLELYKERQSQQSQSQPPSPDPASAAAAPMVQSPTTTITDNVVPMYSNTSPMSSISSATSGSSYGMPNIRQQREASTASTSSTSAYSPATTHTRSFSASSSSITSSPSLSSTSSLHRSASRKRAVKILDVGTGENGTISTLLTLMSGEGLIFPREELEITASETEKRIIDKLKNEKFKGLNHVKIRAFAPEAIPATAETYSFVFHNMGMHWVRDEDSTLHESHRVLRPGGTVGFTSFQSIGYESSGPENLTNILPNSGWSSPARIHKKLLKHGFTDIQIFEYRYPHQWEKVNKTGKQVIQFVIDHAIKKLWKDENDSEIDQDTKCEMRDQLMSMFENGDCTGDVVALITLARKPELQAGVSYF